MTSPRTAVNAPRAWVDDTHICDLHHPRITICDGLGGLLHLDLTQPGLDELAHACTALLAATLAPGSCMIRVWVGDDTFQLRQATRAPITIGITRITRLETEARGLALSEDVLRLVIQLLDSTQHLRTPDSVPGSSLISYVL